MDDIAKVDDAMRREDIGEGIRTRVLARLFGADAVAAYRAPDPDEPQFRKVLREVRGYRSAARTGGRRAPTGRTSRCGDVGPSPYAERREH